MTEKFEVLAFHLGDLKGFAICERTEVFRTDDDGFQVSSAGLFQKPEIAQAYAEEQTDGSYKTRPVLALVREGDHPVAFIIEQKLSSVIFNDTVEAERMRLKILESLTPAQRALLERTLK